MRQILFSKRNILSLFLFVNFTLFDTSCKKFIEVDPPSTSLNAGNVFATDATAAAVLTDIYAEMSAQNNNLGSQYVTSIPLYTSLSADELILYDLNNQGALTYYRNDLNNRTIPNYWDAIYPQIFAANNAIDGLSSSTGLTPSVKNQLLGEAKFIRAFCYFYLVNIFGDIPLVLNLDYKNNALLSRTPVTQVYQQIIKDLKEAQTLLSEDYLMEDAATAYSMGSEERVRPTQWAATALLSRTYLYASDYVDAEVEATKLINESAHFSLTDLNETFLKNNKEAIWQLQPVGINDAANTGEGKQFILTADGPNASYPFYLNAQLISSFEKNDLRKKEWIDSVIVNGVIYYYAYKYKIGREIALPQEYPTIFRLSEQYLIRSEARAQQNKVDGANADLNIIRKRAGLSDLALSDKTTILNAILKERRLELFTEWGHRWFDLKRTHTIDAVMSAVASLKGSSWSPYKAFYPIPQTDLNNDPNLVQNPGYN